MLGLAPCMLSRVLFYGIAASGDFSQTNTCGSSLNVGNSCNITVTFGPTTAGARKGQLTITDNALGSPRTVALTGAGLGAIAALSTNAISFPSQIIGTTSATQSVTLSNTGNVNLTTSGISITGTNSGDFTIASGGTCPASGGTLSAGANCTINITFKPTTVGSRSATLTITDNAPGSPHNVSLAGTAVDFAINPAAGSSTSATVTAGQTANYSLSVAGTTGFAGTVTLTCSGAPLGSTLSS